MSRRFKIVHSSPHIWDLFLEREREVAIQTKPRFLQLFGIQVDKYINEKYWQYVTFTSSEDNALVALKAYQDMYNRQDQREAERAAHVVTEKIYE